MSLATCPVCRCVVDGQEEHARAWHEPLARALAFAAVVAGEPGHEDGGRAWGGPPVALPPGAPTEQETTLAAARRERAQAVVAAAMDVLPALDAYLAATATQAPTAAQVGAQVRLLTQVARGLLLAVRDLVRLTVRAVED